MISNLLIICPNEISFIINLLSNILIGMFLLFISF